MTNELQTAPDEQAQAPDRHLTRRALIGGGFALGAVAAAYAAFGDQLGASTGGSGAAAVATEAVDPTALQQESVRISHLLRRAGFGATREEYDRYQSMGLDATLDEIFNYGAIDDSAAVQLANQYPH